MAALHVEVVVRHRPCGGAPSARERRRIGPGPGEEGGGFSPPKMVALESGMPKCGEKWPAQTRRVRGWPPRQDIAAEGETEYEVHGHEDAAAADAGRGGEHDGDGGDEGHPEIGAVQRRKHELRPSPSAPRLVAKHY